MKNDYSIHTFHLRIKIFIARIIYSLLKLFKLDDNLEINRKNIFWNIDINDIVGLSIFLTGGFQNKKLKQFNKLIKKDSLLIDIGANIGSFTIVTQTNNRNVSKAICIEPDINNYLKLKNNIEINNLVKHTFPFLSFVGRSLDSNSSSHYPLKIPKEDIKNRYNGIPGSFEKAKPFNLEIIENEIKNNLAIKIDVDGNEFEVISALENIIRKYKPLLLIEINKALLDNQELEKIYKLLEESSYMISAGKRLKKIDYLKKSKKLYGLDLILKPI
tara:strand:- start:2895 stop:3713 length:819 start_codon:yes stop_codon:yes gene_type:complete